ncbi:MAG: hypothetical protein IT236_06205 [Bacteroidia bacterium]|nr:hypothetical protein [Bacteroidia bacterium]
MKNSYLLLALCVCLHKATAQKQSINTEVLSTIIAEKQRQVKKKVISDIVYQNGRKALFINYATYNTFYYTLQAITNNSNKSTITKSVLKELSLYIAANALTELFYLKNSKSNTYSLSLLPDNSSNSELYSTEGYDAVQEIDTARYSDLSERSAVLDAVYAALFYELKKQGNFDLVDNRNYIATGLESHSLSATMAQSLNSFTAGLSKLLEQLPDSLNMKDFAEEIKNQRKSSNTLLGNLSNNSQLSEFLFNLGIHTNKNAAISPDIQNNLRPTLTWISILVNYKHMTNLRNITPAEIETLKLALTQILDKLKSYRDLRAIITLAETVLENLNVEVNTSPNAANSTYPLLFNLDVEQIILSLEDKFYNNRTVMKRTFLGFGIKPDFSIGLNYLYFGKGTKGQTEFTNQVVGQTQFNYVGLASEKIGIKLMAFDRRYTHSFNPGEWFQYKGKQSYRQWNVPVSKNPAITHGYVNAYFSGILYNIVDVKTNKNFDYSFFGTGAGITLFNNLDVNVSVAWLMKKEFMMLDKNNLFYSVSFDIPIFEYIKAIKN